MQSWPLSFMTGEWCEAERDVLFHVSNDAGARMMGLRGASDLCGRRASELGWSPEELTRWADEMKRTDEGGRCAVERETVLPDGSKSIRVCSVRKFKLPPHTQPANTLTHTCTLSHSLKPTQPHTITQTIHIQRTQLTLVRVCCSGRLTAAATFASSIRWRTSLRRARAPANSTSGSSYSTRLRWGACE